MKITLIVNPKSGRGKALAIARSITTLLDQRSHRVRTLEFASDQELIHSEITDSDRVVIIGGDGTVHHLLPILAKTQTPMYHLGTGTANLISKEFGMFNSPAKVVEHLENESEPTSIDLPTCNGVPFLIMVSLGIDASVIHRFEESRTHRGGYRAYIQPVVREVLHPRIANISIKHADHPPYQHSGILIVSNLRSYGGGFNPSPNADPTDGLLDAVAIKCTTSVGAGLQYGFLKTRRSSVKMKRVFSDSFQITGNRTPSNVQIDGEKASRIPGLDDGILKPGELLEIQMSKDQIQIQAPIYHGAR